MTYRDDHEALEARVDELEDELAEANAKIARLRGRAATDVALDEIDAWTGSPKMITLERQLPFRVTDEGMLAVADLVHARSRGGEATQMGDTWTHRLGPEELRLSRTKEGTTLLRARRDERGLRGRLALSIVASTILAGLFGGLRLGRPGMAIGAVLGFFGGFVLLRPLFQVLATRSCERLTDIFEDIAELAARHETPPL